jgi:hypothetical protein
MHRHTTNDNKFAKDSDKFSGDEASGSRMTPLLILVTSKISLNGNIIGVS